MPGEVIRLSEAEALAREAKIRAGRKPRTPADEAKERETEIERLRRVLQDSLDTLELATGGGIVASQEDVDEAGAKGKTVVIAEDAAWAARRGLEAYRALVALGAASPNPNAEKFFVGADKALWKYADMPLENVYPEMLILDYYGLKALSALAGVVSGFLAGMAARATVKIGLKAVLPRIAGVVVGGARLVGGLGTITGVPAIVRPLGVTIPGIGWLAALPMTGLAALQSAASKKPFAEEFTAHLVALFGPGGEGVRAPESSSKDILRRMHLSSGKPAVDFLPELVVDLVIMALVGGASQAGKRLAPRIEARMVRLPVDLQNTVRELAGRISLGVKMSAGDIRKAFPLGMTIKESSYLSELIEYEGKIRTRASVLGDLRAKGISQSAIEGYMMGKKAVSPAPPSPVPQPSRPPLGKPLPTTTGRIEKVVSEVKGAQPPRPPAKVAVDLADIKTPADVNKVAKVVFNSDAEAINAQRRGVVPDRWVKERAAALGLTVEQLKDILPGTATNVESAYGTMALTEKSLKDIKSAADNPALSDQGFLDQLAGAQRILAVDAGFTAEAARVVRIRGLGSLRVKAYRKLMQSLQEQFKGQPPEIVAKRTRDALKKVDFNDPEAVMQIAEILHRSANRTWEDYLKWGWYQWILSSPLTSVRNITGNMLTTLTRSPELELAALIDKAAAGLGRGKSERVLGESLAYMIGLEKGAVDIWKLGLDRLPSELTSAGKIEAREIAGKYAKFFPTGWLTIQDNYQKALAFYAETYVQAFRQAAKEGLRGRELLARADELYKSPDIGMVKAAVDAGRYVTFNSPLDKYGQAFMDLRDAIPFGWVPMSFVRTPWNIAKYGLERTPLNYLRLLKRQLGKEPLPRSEVIDGLARASMGSAILFTIGALVRAGLITGGGPTDRNEQAALRRTGWLPYSIKIGGKYYGYGSLEPIGITVGLSADASELVGAGGPQSDEVVAKAGLAIAKNLTSKTFLSGLSDMINVISDPDRYGERWFQRLGGTLVPSGINWAGKSLDPNEREVRGMIDAWKSRIPGLREKLPVRTDIWGEPLKREAGLAGRALSPVEAVAAKPSALEAELARLRIFPSPLKRDATEAERAAKTVKMQNVKRALEQLFSLDWYKALSDQDRVDIVEGILRRPEDSWGYISKIVSRSAWLTRFFEALDEARAETKAAGKRTDRHQSLLDADKVIAELRGQMRDIDDSTLPWAEKIKRLLPLRDQVDAAARASVEGQRRGLPTPTWRPPTGPTGGGMPYNPHKQMPQPK